MFTTDFMHELHRSSAPSHYHHEAYESLLDELKKQAPDRWLT